MKLLKGFELPLQARLQKEAFVPATANSPHLVVQLMLWFMLVGKWGKAVQLQKPSLRLGKKPKINHVSTDTSRRSRARMGRTWDVVYWLPASCLPSIVTTNYSAESWPESPSTGLQTSWWKLWRKKPHINKSYQIPLVSPSSWRGECLQSWGHILMGKAKYAVLACATGSGSDKPATAATYNYKWPPVASCHQNKVYSHFCELVKMISPQK